MKPATPTEEARQLYLPNFCSASAVLVIVLICELTALLLALGRNTAALSFWADLGLTSMFLLWIALCGAALLCLLRNYINSKTVGVGSAMVLGITVSLVILISWLAWYFGNADVAFEAWPFLLRNAGITFLVTALALRYFYVTHLWRHNVELQARARVHALQARIRPHFLFNSMNTIAALTRSNPARAEERKRSRIWPTCFAPTSMRSATR
jgi:two-component system, LytTR family, sensor histidine kinase AlgZ